MEVDFQFFDVPVDLTNAFVGESEIWVSAKGLWRVSQFNWRKLRDIHTSICSGIYDQSSYWMRGKQTGSRDQTRIKGKSLKILLQSCFLKLSS